MCIASFCKAEKKKKLFILVNYYEKVILKVSSWQRFTATEKSSSRKTQRMSNSLHELPKSFLAIWWIVKVMWWNKNVAKKVCKKDKSFVSDRFGYQTSSQGVLYVLSQKWVTSNFAGKIKNPWETWRLTGWRNCVCGGTQMRIVDKRLWRFTRLSLFDGMCLSCGTICWLLVY